MRSTMDQWRDRICMEQTVTVTFPRGCAKGGKDDAAEGGKKGFINLLEFILFTCKGKLEVNKKWGRGGLVRETNSLFLPSRCSHGCMAVTAYLLTLFLHCFPPDFAGFTCREPFPNHQSRNGPTFCNINYLLEIRAAAPQVQAVPYIIPQEEQCTGVITNSRRG